MLKCNTTNKHTMPLQSNSLKTGLLFLFIVPTILCFSQKNSPWKKLSNQTVSGVYLGLGRHQYSLDGGQGFSVYIKNYNPTPVIVSGKVIAKTLCGTEVTTSFSTTLAPDQESSGGNYADSSNSQTGVVTKDDCAGKKTYISAKHAVTNRIQDVYVRDIVVQNVGSAPIQSSNSLQTSIPKITPTTVNTNPQNGTGNTQIIPSSTYKQKYDSLSGIVGFLKERNVNLQDSLINLKSQLYLKKDSLIHSPIFKKKDKKYKVFNTTPYLGIGWEHIPMILNQDSVVASSSSDASSHPTLMAGATFSFFDHFPISLQFNPFVSYGINLGSNTCGNHFASGGLLRLLAGLKYDAPVKLFIEGGIIYRDGSWSKKITIASLKTQQSGNYEYNVTRIGGGFQYQWAGGNSYLRPGIFFEKPSLGVSTTVLSLEAQFSKKWKVGVNYADNYFVAGTVKHPTTFTNNTQNYFNLRLNYNIGTF